MKDNLLSELLSIEAFAEELRQRCYRARKSLEGVYPPAFSKKSKKGLSEMEVNRLITNRKKAILKKLK